MKRSALIFLSLFLTLTFTLFSYSVAKEQWNQIDFDTTVKIQDRIHVRFDDNFSLLSLLGSAEVTFAIAFLATAFYLTRKRFMAALAWLMIIPASMAEVFGKLILYHPGTPVLFHRNTLDTHLPSFYIHTNFSYPSGHMTRTIFLTTVFFFIVLNSNLNIFLKIILLSGLVAFSLLMALTRVSLGEHWLSDVIGGIFLGMAAGFFTSAFLTKRVT